MLWAGEALRLAAVTPHTSTSCPWDTRRVLGAVYALVQFAGHRISTGMEGAASSTRSANLAALLPSVSW